MVQTRQKKLRKEADRLWYLACFRKWGRKCEVCGKLAEQAHHFFPRPYGSLRFNLDNSVPLCQKCHFEHHQRGNPMIHQRVVAKRGLEWYNQLVKESKKIIPSYKNVAYYEEKIKELKNFLIGY